MNNNSKALFFDRFIAFIIDFILIYLIVILISSPFTDTKRNTLLQQQADEVRLKFTNNEISSQEFLMDYSDCYYKIARENGISSLVLIIVYILYFVVYQTYNNGKTFGKKIMKIRVVSDSSLTINQMIFRSFLADFILLELISFIFMLFLSKKIFFSCIGLISVIQYLMVFISIIMIFKREDGCSIHDILTNTRVIKEK